jgi:hypothetical protein
MDKDGGLSEEGELTYKTVLYSNSRKEKGDQKD